VSSDVVPTPEVDLNDERALQLVLEGQQRAFEGLIAKYQASVRRVVSGVHDAALAEALVQQTFIDAYKKLWRFRRGSDLGVWLRGIALNLLRAELRKRGRESKLLRSYHEYVLARSQVDEAAERERHNMAESIDECIKQLAPLASRAVQLRYEEGHDIPEVAQLLNKSVLATRQLLFRVRATLRLCAEQRLNRA
jgi:RNA polymerase sigma factor (sigma-70 family)